MLLIYKNTQNVLLLYLALSSPPKWPSLCQTLRGGRDKGDFYFKQIYILQKIGNKN